MLATKTKLQELLKTGTIYILEAREDALSKKSSPEKWSKKEILGHLIDSAINNLQRFTEIQFETKPYTIRGYKQNDLVIANDYQKTNTKELLNLWVSLNRRIATLMGSQTDETLAYTIDLGNHKMVDLRFLMTDYVTHLEHHLQQITAE